MLQTICEPSSYLGKIEGYKNRVQSNPRQHYNTEIYDRRVERGKSAVLWKFNYFIVQTIKRGGGGTVGHF